MTLSYYTIFSDSLNDREDSVLFSTRTTEALVISKKIREIIENGAFDEIPKKIYKELIEKKMIVNQNEAELVSIIDENKDAIKKDTVLYEVIQPTAYCQLGCDYCGQIHTKDYLTTDLQKLLVERIRKKSEKKKWNNMVIGWFGGEPLVELYQKNL